MRLKKENPVLRNERKKLFKNKTLFEGNKLIELKMKIIMKIKIKN